MSSIASLKETILTECKEVLSSKVTRIFLFISITMLVLEYFGWQGPFFKLIAPLLNGHQLERSSYSFLAQIYTTVSFFILFVCLPLIFMPFLRKETSISYGLSLPPKKNWIPYLLIALGMFVILSIVCNDPSFYKFYPLYRPTNWKSWLLFECVYMPQFFAVEFFFRGPLLYLLNKEIERGSEAMMTLPYCLIHIHKPFPEAVGSIIAGIVLSRLSLKGKSILPRVAIHMFVALSADFFGLFYSGTISRW